MRGSSGEPRGHANVDALRPTWEAMAARLRDADQRIGAEADRQRAQVKTQRGSGQHLPHVLAKTLDWCVSVLRGAPPMHDEVGEVMIATRMEVPTETQGPALVRDPSCTRCTEGRTRVGTLCGCVTEVQSC